LEEGVSGWKRRFDDPIPLSNGRVLSTLEDAARYIQKLPKAEQMLLEWQTAIEALFLVAETNGPTMLARIGVMKALNAGKPAPARKRRAKTYRLVR
jgi:hypothetical protein